MIDPGEYPFPKIFTLLTASWIDGIVEEYINFEFVLKFYWFFLIA